MTQNISCRVTNVFLIFVASCSLRAESKTLVFKTQGPGAETYSLTFDTSRIPKQEMEKFAWLSPHFPVDLHGQFQSAQSDDAGFLEKVFIAPSLELCVDGDSNYAPCGSRDLSAPNFFRNGQTNLEKGRRELMLLKTMPHLKDLDPVVRYLVENLTFSLWLQETRLDFYKTWDVKALERKYNNFDPSVNCPDILKSIRGASTDQAYKLALHDRHNCMLGSVSSSFGHYPIDAWRKFLEDYGIRESYRVESVE